MKVIVWVFVSGGFWTVGHFEAFRYNATCEQSLPKVEEIAKAHGYTVTYLKCVELKDPT